MTLIKNHPIALYYQLSELLREQIESEQFKVGEQIPSVRDLAAQYKISPVTARLAISELVKQGLLIVKRGVGTFVAAPKIAYDTLRLTGFSEDMVERGLTSHSQLLHLGVEVPSPHIVEQLNISAEDQIVRIARLRYSDESPIVLDQSYVPVSICPGLENQNLADNSLYALLEGQYDLELARSYQWLEATIANNYEADLFGIKAGAPILLVRGVTYLKNGHPIEYFKVIYRGDRFKFGFETSRAPHRR